MDKLKREETKYRDNLAIEFGTTALEWKKIDSRTMSHSIATKNRSFMYRFNNGITYNNTDFHRFGYKESDKCSFCKQEKQTNRHLFWECSIIRKFWEDINKRLVDKKIRKKEVFLGENEEEDKIKERAINNIIAAALQYIYTANYKASEVNTRGLWEKLKYTEKIEREIAEQRNNIINHLTKWESIEEMIKDDCFIISDNNPDPEDKDSDRNRGEEGRRGNEENGNKQGARVARKRKREEAEEKEEEEAKRRKPTKY